MNSRLYNNNPYLSLLFCKKSLCQLYYIYFFSGTQAEFSEWIAEINTKLLKYGLNIDESTIAAPSEFVSFLDIQFCFSTDGNLETDLYVKPTDARTYLQYGSAHPNHIYSGIIYSQCFRLRRIINSNSRLHIRIGELKQAFLNSNYPKNMIQNISDKVLKMERKLPAPDKSSNALTTSPELPSPIKRPTIRVISTFGSDSDLVEIVGRFEPSLLSSPSFSNSSPDLRSSSETPTKHKGLLQFVKRTGSSLRNKLVKTKQLALNKTNRRTSPCGHGNCKCCQLISDKDRIIINGVTAKPTGGNCKTRNVIYCFSCKLCGKAYVGRTVQPLHLRTGQHRRKYHDMLKDVHTCLLDDKFRKDDEFSLGIHLLEDHNLCNKSDFNNYELFILDICSPKSLELNEHRFIQSLKTIKPKGINSVDPFGIPLLDLL